MKKIFLFLIFFQLLNFQSLIAKDLWAEAKNGDKIILIRHALAPGGGDPPGFKINDCKTQRNSNGKKKSGRTCAKEFRNS